MLGYQGVKEQVSEHSTQHTHTKGDPCKFSHTCSLPVEHSERVFSGEKEVYLFRMMCEASSALFISQQTSRDVLYFCLSESRTGTEQTRRSRTEQGDACGSPPAPYLGSHREGLLPSLLSGGSSSTAVRELRAGCGLCPAEPSVHRTGSKLHPRSLISAGQCRGAAFPPCSPLLTW